MIPLDDARLWVEENVLTASEAAEYLGMTRSGIWRAVDVGKLSCIREKLFLKDELDYYQANVKTGRPRKK